MFLIKKKRVHHWRDTLGAETFAGRNFRVSKKNAKYLTKTFAFGDFWNKFRGKNFREFKIRFVFA